MSSSKNIFQAQKLSVVSSSRLLCINSFYATIILLSLIVECGKHATISTLSIMQVTIVLNFMNVESGLTLSPPEVVSVCFGAELTITCSTDRRFLNWNVTIPPSASESGQAITRSLLFSSSTQNVGVLMVGTRAFNISITSTMDPFSSILSSTNVTADLNETVIECSDRGSTVKESRSSMANVHVITAADFGRFTVGNNVCQVFT